MATRRCRLHRARRARRARPRVLERDLGPVLVRDLAHDRQARAREPSTSRAERAVEGLEHQLALGLAECPGRCPRPAAPRPGRTGRPARARSPCRRPACTAARCRPGCGSARAPAPAGPITRGVAVVALRAFVAEVDAACPSRAARSRAPSRSPAARRSHLLHAPRLLLVLGARHRQQLVDHVRGALARAGDLLQRALQRLRVALARVDLALRQLGLRAQARPAASSAGAPRRRGSASARRSSGRAAPAGR